MFTDTPSIDLEQVLGYEFEPYIKHYTPRDVSLYGLGIGLAQDPMDRDELRFVYEQHPEGLQVFPTMPVTFPAFGIIKVPGLVYNPMMLLHGEQFLEIKKPLATEATITSKARVSHVYDKGKGVILIMDTICTDEHGDEVSHNQSSVYIRGLGSFGGDRGPSGTINEPPERPPDAVIEGVTTPNQALIYRLSGDYNPLHADPEMAAIGQFPRPILHGLCFFGIGARAVLKQFADNDPARFKNIKVRFARHVFPGETIATEMWQESATRIVFRSKVVERDEYCLTNAAVEFHP